MEVSVPVRRLGVWPFSAAGAASVKIELEEIDLYAVLQVAPTAHPAVIQAAYRALARIFHPDQTAGDNGAMAIVNRAYGVLREPESRNAYDAGRAERRHQPAPATSPPVAPAAAQARSAGEAGRATNGTVLPYGRYAGWTLEQLAARDPEYLRWLSRHTSGLRYRARITELLSRQGVGGAAAHGSQRRAPAWTR